MLRFKAILLIVVSFTLILLVQSCAKKPFACFQTLPDEDSIHVNQQVIFSSACTNNGNDFSWEFYNNIDSIEFGKTVAKTFNNTGTVHVYLLVVNGLNQSGFSKDIVVRP